MTGQASSGVISEPIRSLRPAVLAAACAVVMLAIDAPRLSHGRSYSLAHWYMVWFWGVYLVGAGLLLKAIVRRAAEWMRTPVSRKAPGF